jgi:hypothetical protein
VGAGYFKPQTVLLRWRGLRGGGSTSGDGQTLVAGVVLGEPGCAYEKEEGEIRLRRRLAGEKDFSPELAGRGGLPRLQSGLRYRALH